MRNTLWSTEYKKVKLSEKWGWSIRWQERRPSWLLPKCAKNSQAVYWPRLTTIVSSTSSNHCWPWRWSTRSRFWSRSQTSKTYPSGRSASSVQHAWKWTIGWDRLCMKKVQADLSIIYLCLGWSSSIRLATESKLVSINPSIFSWLASCLMKTRITTSAPELSATTCIFTKSIGPF